jgi:hypothetical protein
LNFYVWFQLAGWGLGLLLGSARLFRGREVTKKQTVDGIWCLTLTGRNLCLESIMRDWGGKE